MAIKITLSDGTTEIDSYVSFDDTNTYFQSDFFYNTWREFIVMNTETVTDTSGPTPVTTTNMDQVLRLLSYASRVLIDGHNFRDPKDDPAQPLEFPKNGMTPDAVLEATYQMIKDFILHPTDYSTSTGASIALGRIKSLASGRNRIEFQGGATIETSRTVRTNLEITPRELAERLLQPYLAEITSSDVVANESFGTDCPSYASNQDRWNIAY